MLLAACNLWTCGLEIPPLPPSSCCYCKSSNHHAKLCNKVLCNVGCAHRPLPVLVLGKELSTIPRVRALGSAIKQLSLQMQQPSLQAAGKTMGRKGVRCGQHDIYLGGPPKANRQTLCLAVPCEVPSCRGGRVRAGGGGGEMVRSFVCTAGPRMHSTATALSPRREHGHIVQHASGCRWKCA